MLILDKRKAIERVMALTTVSTAAEPEPAPVRTRRRTAQRIATYERQATPAEVGAAAKVADAPRRERKRRVRPTVGPASAPA